MMGMGVFVPAVPALFQHAGTEIACIIGFFCV
jgi:hypothetical protein